MSRLTGIHDLVYCFQRLGGAGSSGYQQDWVGLGANIGGLLGKAAWYAKGQYGPLKTALEDFSKLAKQGKTTLPTPTAIVDVAMVAITIVDFLNGLGPVEKGGDFTSGADKLEIVRLHLDGAVPRPKEWSGDAAKAYADMNAALMALVEDMKDIDKRMGSLVAKQAGEVQKAHNVIAYTLMGLIFAQGIALALYLIPVVGPEVSCAWQILAAFAACATVFAFEMFTLSESITNSHSADALAAEYAEVGAAAGPSGTFGRIEVAGAEEVTVSSFKAISDSMSGPSALSSVPTVAQLAALAPVDGLEEKCAALRTLAGAESPAADAPETPETPTDPTVPAAPTAPAFTLPTMAQVSQASAQAAKISGHASQQMNLVNQTMGSVQQLASMGQQGQGAAAPAEQAVADEAKAPEEAALAGDAEGAGAAPGAEAAGRAPVDAGAAGAERAQEPIAAERMV